MIQFSYVFVGEEAYICIIMYHTNNFGPLQHRACPMLHTCEEAAVRNTQYLETVFAKPDNMALECLWGRAILPWCWDKGCVENSGADETVICTNGFGQAVGDARQVYIDGSGGMKDTPNAARRVGSWAVVVTVGAASNIEQLEMAMVEVPGRQTSPRAELMAAIIVAKSCPSGARLRIRPVATYIVEGIKRWRGPKRC